MDLSKSYPYSMDRVKKEKNSKKLLHKKCWFERTMNAIP